MQICVVKTSALGDILHAFPVLSYLRHRFPNAQIDWIVERPYAALLRAHPDITQVLEVDTKAWRRQPFSRATWSRFLETRKALRQKQYDLLFDLQGNIKSGLLTSQVRCKEKVGPSWRSAAELLHPLFTHHHISLAKGVNVRTALVKMVQTYFKDQEAFKFEEIRAPLKLSLEEQKEVTQLFEGLESLSSRAGPLILIAPGSIWKNKQLTAPQLLTFLQRVQQITQATFLFSWGSEEEHHQASLLAAALPGAHLLDKRYTLPQFSAIIARVDLLIGMDSLPLHLAAATTTTPTFAFFGPSAAPIYNPIGGQHHAFQGICPYGVQMITRCSKLRRCPTGACLREVDVEALVNAFMKSYSCLTTQTSSG